MGRAAVRARMKRRACQGLGRRGYAHRSSTTDLERESKSAFLPKENCNRQQTTTRTPAPALIRNASAKRSRPGRGRPGVAPAGSVYGAVISGRFCVDQDLNIDLGPKSSSGPGFDTDHTKSSEIFLLDVIHISSSSEQLPCRLQPPDASKTHSTAYACSMPPSACSWPACLLGAEG